jgi:hypothetical protein
MEKHPSTTRGVSHCGLAIYIKEYLSEGKRRIRKTQIFHQAKLYLIFKKCSKRNQNPSKIL